MNEICLTKKFELLNINNSEKLILPNDLLIYILEFIYQTGPLSLTYDINKKIFIEIENPIYLQYKIDVKIWGLALEYIDDQTEELCKLAVQEDGYSLKYVKNKTEEICILAIHQNPFSLRFVEEQTEEMCKISVQENGDTLKYVKNKTEEICILAIKQYSRAIKHVENPTEEMYKLASLKYGCNLYDIMQWALF
jgi:ribosomal protein L24E